MKSIFPVSNVVDQFRSVLLTLIMSPCMFSLSLCNSPAPLQILGTMIVLSVDIAKIDALALLICQICNLIEKLTVSFSVFEDLVDRLLS